jgi:hypothetical protein
MAMWPPNELPDPMRLGVVGFQLLVGSAVNGGVVETVVVEEVVL